MEPNQECYNSQDPNDPFFSDKIIINEETEILMEESEGMFDKISITNLKHFISSINKYGTKKYILTKNFF